MHRSTALKQDGADARSLASFRAGFFYSGLLRRKNALSMIYLSMAGLAVVSFQWFFWGYSLAFSVSRPAPFSSATMHAPAAPSELTIHVLHISQETGSKYIGDLRYFALRNVYEAPSMGGTKIPASLYMICQSTRDTPSIHPPFAR